MDVIVEDIARLFDAPPSGSDDDSEAEKENLWEDVKPVRNAGDVYRVLQPGWTHTTIPPGDLP